MVRTVCYPGSFDPLTLGHLDLVTRTLKIFDRVVLAIGVNGAKVAVFSPEEREALIREVVAPFGDRVAVTKFSGLAVDFCRAQGLTTLLRGIRTASDLEAEMAMAATNRTLDPTIETILLMASTAHAFTSSRLIKEIVRSNGPVEAFVPPPVARALRRRMSGAEDQR